MQTSKSPFLSAFCTSVLTVFGTISTAYASDPPPTIVNNTTPVPAPFMMAFTPSVSENDVDDVLVSSALPGAPSLYLCEDATSQLSNPDPNWACSVLVNLPGGLYPTEARWVNKPTWKSRNIYNVSAGGFFPGASGGMLLYDRDNDTTHVLTGPHTGVLFAQSNEWFDMDNDGDLDLIAGAIQFIPSTSEPSGLYWLENPCDGPATQCQLTGNWQSHLIDSSHNGTRYEVIKYKGDNYIISGHQDLLAPSFAGEIALYRINQPKIAGGAPSFDKIVVESLVGVTPFDVGFADMNGDGKPEITSSLNNFGLRFYEIPQNLDNNSVFIAHDVEILDPANENARFYPGGMIVVDAPFKLREVYLSGFLACTYYRITKDIQDPNDWNFSWSRIAGLSSTDCSGVYPDITDLDGDGYPEVLGSLTNIGEINLLTYKPSN